MKRGAEHYDLVALDMDGTILDQRFEGGFSDRVIDTIQAVQQRGVIVTLATGRTLDFVARHVGRLGITAPVVSTQGAIVGDPLSRSLLSETLIPETIAPDMLRWIIDSNRVAVIYFSDGKGGTVMVQNREEWDAKVYDHWFGEGRRLSGDLSDILQEMHPLRPIKFIAINDIETEADLSDELRKRFGENLVISRSHQLLVEGAAAGVDKGRGLLRLLEHLKIDRSRILAIGDNENDIPMLQVAGTAVAMGQASEAVKAVADWVAPSIAEDGAAVALRHFILD